MRLLITNFVGEDAVIEETSGFLSGCYFILTVLQCIEPGIFFHSE